MSIHRLEESVLISDFLRQTDEEIFLKEADKAVLNAAAGKTEYFSVSFCIQKIDPLAVLEQYARVTEFEYYWEKPNDHFAIAAAGELARVQATGPNRFKDSSTLGKQIFSKVSHFTATDNYRSNLHLLGGFSFFDHNVGKYWKDFGAASFTFPEWMIVRDKDDYILTVNFRIEKNDGAEDLVNRFYDKLAGLNDFTNAETYKIEAQSGSKINREPSSPGEHERWINKVLKAKEHIKEGAYSKIVLAREVFLPLQKDLSVTRALNYLRLNYPDCYNFMIRQGKDSCFFGSTPERLAYFNQNELHTEGLAGSSPRGSSASEDAKLEYDLLHSQKNLNEHNFVLDAISEDLLPFSDDVEIPEQPTIKKLNNVLHLHTPVKAKISSTVSKTEVLKALHPTPAVGGYPRSASVPFISRLESFDRGWYASPVGWITTGYEADFIVAIRSALVKEDGARLYAGCGIVEASDPEKEWEETNIKLIPMLSALNYAAK